MIDRKIFNIDRLLDNLLDTLYGNVNKWLDGAEIIPKYVSPCAKNNPRPKCVIKHGDSFLRYSQGPRQGFFWDVYGDDFQTPELALLAVIRAPVPPCVLKKEVWGIPPYSHTQNASASAGVE